MNSDHLRLLVNQEVHNCSIAEMLDKAARAKRVHIDIGTGDGKFLYHLAKLHPETLHIGIDAHGEGMKNISRKAARKPSKGGLSVQNLFFVISSIETIPSSWSRCADEITINYPWGTLLSGLLVPDKKVLANVAQLGKPGCTLAILLNFSMFDDRDYIARLCLPLLSEGYVETVLNAAYSQCGLHITNHGELDAKLSTGWKNRLAHAKRDKTYALNAVVKGFQMV